MQGMTRSTTTTMTDGTTEGMLHSRMPVEEGILGEGLA